MFLKYTIHEGARMIFLNRALVNVNGQTLARVFVHHLQQTQCTTVMDSCRNEVVAPHVIRILRTQTHARAVGQPQPNA